MAFAFFGMNAVGVEIENPFGDDDNDLPIKKMMKRIELDTGALLEMRGISDQAVRQETEKKTAPFFKRAIEL
jgi:ion channel-forming bestrophin family protein